MSSDSRLSHVSAASQLSSPHAPSRLKVRGQEGYGLVDCTKTFNCHVHNNVKLDGLLLRIVDTPEYQRLHFLKQNGTTDYVFRGATHTRFEHSIGVAHLAERFVKTVQFNQVRLHIFILARLFFVYFIYFAHFYSHR